MTTTTTPAGLLSIRAAADRVGFSEKTIRRAIATRGNHHLRATKLRGEWRIDPNDLNDWIASYAAPAVTR